MGSKTGFIGIFGLVAMIIGSCLQTWLGHVVFRCPRLANYHQIIGTLLVTAAGAVVYVVTANLEHEWRKESLMATVAQGVFLLWAVFTAYYASRLPEFTPVDPNAISVHQVQTGEVETRDVLYSDAEICDLSVKGECKEKNPIFVSPYEYDMACLMYPNEGYSTDATRMEEVLECGNLPAEVVAYAGGEDDVEFSA
jgi:hypothetical protein